MSAFVAVVLVLVVTGYVVLPLLQPSADGPSPSLPTENERWTREKAVAVLAITEADFDRATGKLSDVDYQVLRADYEGRALHAMDEMEKFVPEVTVVAQYCASCGKAFAAPDAFCSACGRPRRSA